MKDLIDKYLVENFDKEIDDYKTLNDAAQNYGDGYKKGQTEIWYMTSNSFRNLSAGSRFLEKHGGLPTVKDLKNTHILLGDIKETDLDKIFNMMQGEEYSPNGEARSLIRNKRLQHTSMSVGDVIKSKGKYYMVDNNGFYPLEE